MSANIEKIIYINLNKRSDRRELIEKELDDFNLSYERFEAIEIPDLGSLGCGLSHLEVLKMAKEKNYKNILILEDDFKFLVSKEEFENQLDAFFKLELDYDICCLSYGLKRYTPLENNIVNKILETQTTSGYIVNNKYYDKLIELFEYAMPLLKETKMHVIYGIDMIWKKLQEKDNWYYFIKRIGLQRDDYSDIEGTFVSYNC